VNVLGDLSDTTDRIETERLSEALSTVGDIVEASGPELEGAMDGITRLSQTVSSRDAELKTLLASSKDLTALLDDRKNDLMEIMQSGQAVFRELRNRKDS